MKNTVVTRLATRKNKVGGADVPVVVEALRPRAEAALRAAAEALDVSVASVTDCWAENYYEVVHTNGEEKLRKGFSAMVVHCLVQNPGVNEPEEKQIWTNESHRRLPEEMTGFFGEVALEAMPWTVDHFVDPNGSPYYRSPFQQNIGLGLVLDAPPEHGASENAQALKQVVNY